VAQRSRLFQHLTEADSFTTPKHGGTALGLITCSQLVALVGGAGSNPGAATAQRVIRACSDVTPVLSAGADGTQRRGVCSRLACDVGAPANGQRAIWAFAADGYELLRDSVVPGLDGYEASAEIRRIEAVGAPRSWQ
jgi:hypothetical protein